MATLGEDDEVITNGVEGSYNERNDKASFVQNSEQKFIDSEHRNLARNLINLKQSERQFWSLTNG